MDLFAILNSLLADYHEIRERGLNIEGGAEGTEVKSRAGAFNALGMQV
jgi:hypothetical protein